ncbi:helix-turn-helix transcriptional regulator [Paenibacillus frigoriresistens]|uniref:helix-turn-helix transcriptional regulator n=1 Tax=Paenibacillus alginolyticus TaxID=59839 RepID=UPI001564EA40|nr:helix-turn-helix transcriptional regulator [Paenibacillus frigoriresistens]NRF93613.1 helix-turn-helix transcriptional regulator [Paenibacillus frigoriresistens]
MEINGELQNNVYLLRTAKRWSQQEVADRLGVSRQTIASIEANKYNPSLILAFKIAKLFEVEITEVFQYEEYEEEESE